jgi:hypothetical protein
MKALLQQQLSGPPAEEMARLHHAGFSLIPLGRGEDGKSPLLSFGGKPRFPLGHVLAPMHRMGSACYGIRLDGLAVVDCDTDDAVLVKEIEARFGASPVHIRTPRGRHLYYRAKKVQVPNLRREGLPVDLKRGAASYVMGPGSVRPDGGTYLPEKGILGADNLPEIRLPTGQNKAPFAANASGRIPDGSRNYALTLAAIQMVEAVNDPEELLGNLQFIRDDECEDPATVPDEELQKITDWAWSRRLEGKVYRGRNTEFRVPREALDAIMAQPNASDALALFVVLQSQHGHRPAVTFPLDHGAMASAGHTDLSRRRFRDARRALEEAGLLEVAVAHLAAHRRRSYRLKRLRPGMSDAANISELRPSKAGKQGGGV